jgi:RNA polymerase sigma factor (sigma-70 family)
MTAPLAPHRSTPNDLALRYLRWAASIARSLALACGAHHLVDDLVSRAVEAMVEASRTFDPLRGFRFDGYARKHVAGKVMDLIAAEMEHLHFMRRLTRAASRRATSPLGVEAIAESQALDELDALADELLDELELAARASDSAAARVLVNEIGLKLDADEQRLVEVYCIRGLSWEEVATELGIPERTARDRLAKLRARLRRALNE